MIYLHTYSAFRKLVVLIFRIRMKNSKKRISVTWFGHSAFLLETPEGASVLIDPWLDNPSAPAGARVRAHARVILVTHGHGDHLGNTVELAKSSGAEVIAIHELALYLRHAGVEKAAGMNKSGTAVVDGLRITMVDARHSGGIEEGDAVVAGSEPAGFVIRFENGFGVYHAGDTGLFSDMLLIRDLYKPDLVLLPCGGYFTMGPREAARACTMLNPKYIIGMHYGTFPILAGTPEEMRSHLPTPMRKRVHILQPGSTVSLA